MSSFIKKIYINNKPLILTDSAEQYMDRSEATGYLLLKGASGHNLRMAQKHLEKGHTAGAFLEDAADALQAVLYETFRHIEAGGGVVTDPKGRVLMIYRRGKWDLPKGKRDEGETIEACAEREVQEETGLPEVTSGGKLCETYHVYTQAADDFLKTTHWFRMQAKESYALYPQAAESILEARWVPEQELGLYVRQSYEAIREVLAASGAKWEDPLP